MGYRLVNEGDVLAGRVYKKKRSDRNHLLYRITCCDTGESYIGITVMLDRSIAKNLYRRWQQHVYRAHNQDKNWVLSAALREREHFWIEAIDVVRGKESAHALERQLIEEESPMLNSWKKNRNKDL